MSDIYDQHKKHFSQVSAYVVLFCGERVATIAFKFPKDGAGRLYAYVHWLGVQMVRGRAQGANDADKQSAAVIDALQWIAPEDPNRPCALDKAAQGRFIEALKKDDPASGWSQRLRDAGFQVLQAV